LGGGSVTLGPRRVLYSFYLSPESKKALDELAVNRSDTTAETVRTMLRYAMTHMPANYR
jgi:predicted DNA-binding protein